MNSRTVSSRLVAIALALGFAGCGAEPASTTAAALRATFPSHAAEVLEGLEPIAATDGYALRPLAAVSLDGISFEASFSADSERPIEVRLPDGFSVRVRELGASGEVTRVEHALAFRHARGTSYWTASRGRLEEWLVLPAGASAAQPVASWEVEGATLRMRGDAVEIADAAGRTKLQVTAPRAYTKDDRPVPVRLAVNGATIELSVDAALGPALVDPQWTPAGSMQTKRYYHTATLLADGRVLVAGGFDSVVEPIAEAEIYDPSSDVWTPVSPMHEARGYARAVLLDSGRVLVTGGVGSTPLDSAEVYDPASDSWTETGAMSVPRVGHGLARLADGRVLASGANKQPTPDDTAEVYDPATNAWTPVTSMHSGRANHTLTSLEDGRAVAAGGDACMTGSCPATAEVYDPASDTWTLTGPMSGNRHGHDAFLLPDGRVAVVAGDGPANPEVYDPAANAWKNGATPAPGHGHYYQASALLADGGILVTGGSNGNGVTAGADVYDPVGDAWTSVAPMTTPREQHTATRLMDDTVLVAGGDDLATAELYGPPAGTPCASPSDCASGYCVDGVCCSSACAGPCDTCLLSKGAVADGTCGALSCASVAGPCQTGGTCDMTAGCSFGASPDGTTCPGGTCVGGTCVVATGSSASSASSTTGSSASSASSTTTSSSSGFGASSAVSSGGGGSAGAGGAGAGAGGAAGTGGTGLGGSGGSGGVRDLAVIGCACGTTRLASSGGLGPAVLLGMAIAARRRRRRTGAR